MLRPDFVLAQAFACMLTEFLIRSFNLSGSAFCYREFTRVIEY